MTQDRGGDESLAADRTAREVVVHGRVQGVFFRDSCRHEAEAVGVRGWVRNERDGTVRAHFEGPPAGVEHMVAWVHDGPRHARVRHVDVAVVPPQDLHGFEVR